MPAAPVSPGPLVALDTDLRGVPADWDRWLADDARHDVLPADPGLADDAWLMSNPLADGPDLAEDAWLTDDPEWADAAPAVREVLKAGFWDRSAGDGAGFAAGGVLDTLPPGPTLAGLAQDAWADGLGRLTDDELIGVLRAARRLASWATAMELAAVGDLWRRRVAEEDAGDSGVACHADDEVAAALTLTSHAAGRVLDLALGLARLPLTSAALAAGAIDPPRAAVIAGEVIGLGDQHAAAVDRAVAENAPGQTTGQLCAATRRAVLAADPDAARRRKEEALREARVERWAEPAGTAALAGRDLPPAEVLAADQHLTDLAGQLKAAGAAGTMDTLRASVYLALLSGAPVSSLLPADPGATARPGSGWPGPGASSAGAAPPEGSPLPGERPGAAAVPDGLRAPGGLALRGTVHLTLPLATWLGQTDSPGQVAGFGPVDATDSRAVAAALAAHPSTTWCLILTDRDGHPVAHGCARAGPPPGRRRAGSGDRPRAGPTIRTRDQQQPEPPGLPATRSRDRRATGPPEEPEASSGDRARAGPPGPPPTSPRGQPPAGPSDRTWTFTMTLLDNGDCDHAWQTPAYQPTHRLRHLVQVRHATCTFPGCRRPAAQCDQDHTLAYDDGGRTCLCNLAPACRHHHQVKQAPGWALEQSRPGQLTWTTPAGRRYTTTPTKYPS
jgi:hypothetical protein